MYKREREKGSKGWMEEREDFYKQNGFSTEGIKDLRERERGGGEREREREREM